MSKVTYTPRKEGDVHIDSLMWAITNPTTVFDNNSRSSNHLFPENNDDLINQAGDLAWFRLKINVDSDKNVSIHYQCNSKQSPHVPIFMKYNLWNCQRNGTKTECKESIAKQVCTVQSGLWHLAATEPQVNLIKFASELCLRFDFKIIYDIQSVEGKAPEGLSCNDYESFLDNEAFSDVTITSVDRQEFHAHRIVLASRSPVFKALFQHKTTESKTNVIESPFVSYVLKEVLRFMYSDKAPKIDEIPEKLLTAADYYQVLQLKRLCEKELILKLTVENVVETLQLADMHSADALKLLALDFINDGPKKLLTKSAAWAKLKSPELIKEIYEYDLD